jgi:hypothetical protein
VVLCGLTSSRLVFKEGLAVRMRTAAHTALAVPLMIGGGILVLAFGTSNVFAASSATHASVKTPVTSSGPHEHENVVCSPATISAGQPCTVTFTDKKKSDEKHPAGQNVCFSVSPTTAGATATPFTPSCAPVTLVGSTYQASSTFSSNANFCGSAIIYATETKEKQRYHTTETIVCGTSTTNTSFTIPAGSPSPPAGGWLLGAMGVGAALVTGFALRRRFVPRRLAASQSE